MVAINLIVSPKDIVRLTGTNRQGCVLDWVTQIPLDQQQLGSTHYAIQPLDADGKLVQDIVFWPHNMVTLVKPHLTPQAYQHQSYDGLMDRF